MEYQRLRFLIALSSFCRPRGMFRGYDPSSSHINPIPLRALDGTSPVKSTLVAESPPTQTSSRAPSRWARGLGMLRPSHAHTAFSASILLTASSWESSLIGLGRGKYIAWLFGAGPQTDAYVAAFRLPDLMNNFLVGGAVSITIVTILNRYRERDEEV